MPSVRRSQRSTTLRSRGRSKSQSSSLPRGRPMRLDSARRRGAAGLRLQPQLHALVHRPLPRLPQLLPAHTLWCLPASLDRSGLTSLGGYPTHTPLYPPLNKRRRPPLPSQDPHRHTPSQRPNIIRRLLQLRHQHTHLPYHYRLRTLLHPATTMLHQHLIPLSMDQGPMIANDLRLNLTTSNKTPSIKQNR